MNLGLQPILFEIFATYFKLYSAVDIYREG